MSGIFLTLPEFPFPRLFNSFYLPPGGNQLQRKETKMQHCIRKHHSDYILLMSCQQHLQKWDSGSLNWVYDEAVYYLRLS